MLPVLCLFLLPTLQEPDAPLRNDTFLPGNEALEKLLWEGDAAWAEAASGGAEAERARDRAFDGWRRALVESTPGECVRPVDPQTASPGPAAGATGKRRIEGVAVSVLARLLALEPEGRRAWNDRFGDLAAAELAADPSGEETARRVEWEWPGTRAAALAALRLADGALERGETAAARTWLERCERHLRVGEEIFDGPFERALKLRRETITLLRPAPPPAPWRRAESLRLVQALRLETDRVIGRPPRPLPLGRTVDPGALALPLGGAAIQTPRGLIWFDGEVLAGRRSGPIARLDLAEFLDLPRVVPYVYPSAGGWPLRPAGENGRVVLVVGRGIPGRTVGSSQLPARGNHLVCLLPGKPGEAELAWDLADQGLLAPGRPKIPCAEATGLAGHIEFQPGPVVADGKVYVQARVLVDPTAQGEARGGTLHLLALDLETGRALWSRLLTRSADLRRDLGGRNGVTSDVPTSGMPLSLLDGVLIVGTNVGLVCAFEIPGGRWLWGLANQRRDPLEEGWPGSRPALPVELSLGAGFLVAPFDSSYLYALRRGPASPGGLFLLPPLPRGSRLDPIGGAGEELLFLGRDGRHFALRTIRPHRDPRSSLYLGEDERFAGTALASAERILFASNRALYLMDHTREDRLLASLDLPDLDAGRGGSLYAIGDRILVVGRDTLWIVAAE